MFVLVVGVGREGGEGVVGGMFLSCPISVVARISGKYKSRYCMETELTWML